MRYPSLPFATTALRSTALFAALATLALSDAPSGAAPAPAPAGRVVVLSTTDVIGKTSPCGCHVPKGGLSRLAYFADSIRALEPNVLLVDNGGFFPLQDGYEENAVFLMNAMKVLGTDAVGVTEHELRFGRGFLVANAKRSGASLTCANLFDRATRKTLFEPWRLVKRGGVSVGIFALTTDKIDLGPSRDSLMVEDPTAACQRTVQELHKAGATVIVLLSQLGKVESEDLVTAVDGVDAVICGRNMPLLQKGRTIKRTVACYGGEQGQYVGYTVLNLDARRLVTTGDNTMIMLGPEVGDSKNVLIMVKSFEDHFNDMLRKRAKEQAAKDSSAVGQATTPAN